jgi:hypothetical protein
MADGYARASGKPGVCMAQMIGASNLAAGLRDGYMAGAPIIAITGGLTPQSRYRHAYQEVDDVAQFDAVTKFNAQIDHVSRMPDLLRQAFRVATSGAPGPVHLRVQSHLGQITEAEADLDPLVEETYRRAPAFRPAPDMQQVRKALAALSKAERPMIVAGGGVIRSGAAAEVGTRREAVDPGGDLDQRQGRDHRRPSARRRRLRLVFTRLRQSRAGGSRPRVLRREPHRRAGDQQLDVPAGRNPGDPARHRAGGARPQLSEHGLDPWRRQGVAARDDRSAAPRTNGTGWPQRACQLIAEWRDEHEPMRNSDATPIWPGAHLQGYLRRPAAGRRRRV